MKSPCQETFERYLEHRGATLSASTIRRYEASINSLLEFLHRRHPEVDCFSKLRRSPHIEEWLGMLQFAVPPYTDGTRAYFIYQVRRFFKDIGQWGWPGSPPPGLFQSGDIPPIQRSFPPRRRLKPLARRLGTSQNALVANPWYRLLERYLFTRSATLRPGSLTGCRVSVLCLMEFLGRRFPEVDSPAGLLREPHIVGWLHFLVEGRHLKSLTRRHYIGWLRRFFEDVREWGWPERPPPGLIRGDDLPPDPRYAGPRNRFLNLIGVAVPPPADPAQETALHKTLHRYLDIRSATLRPGTLRHYRITVLTLIEFLRLRFPQVDSFSKLRRDPHIEGWLHELARVQPPFRNGTRRERIRALLRFLEDLREWGWPEGPPAGLIRLDDFPPCDHCLPKPLPPEVDAVLMEALLREGDLLSLGLALARRTGLRIGELSRLELDCLLENPQGHHSLRVPLGKLRTERVIPIERETADLIKTLKQLRGDRPPARDPETGRSLELLFCDEQGGFLPCHVFARKLKAVANSAAIAQNVHPHRLRHTFATDLLRNGLSLPGVMKLLGHKTIKMTLRYVEVTNEDLGRDYLRAMEKARQRYSALGAPEVVKTPEQEEPAASIEALFDQLLARIRALRFEHPDPESRRKLQRLMERLRRAQRDFPH